MLSGEHWRRLVAIAERTCTLEEFLRRPERKPALEYFDGRVTQKVSPNVWHSMLQTWLVTWFNLYCVPRKLAFALTELRTTFAGASPIPDVSVIRWERLRRDAAGLTQLDFVDAPDIAIEILSPGQRRNKLRARCRWYVEHGALVSVLVDPSDFSARVFQTGQTEQVLHGPELIDFSSVVPGLQLTVDELFGALRLD
jgi:Uma2 family endonuclease